MEGKVSWDQSLPAEFADQARKILKELLKINLEFPRYVILSNAELHVFSDASAKAYGAVAYVLCCNSSNLLVSKQRIAPCNKHTLTIPKLELTAVLLGARLSRHLCELFAFSKVHLWTDSSVAISWIQSRKDIKDVYVSHRVFEIRNLVSNYQIALHHVPTKDNPADLLSRGCNVSQLSNNQLWFHGPIPLMINPISNEINDNLIVFEIITEIAPLPAIAPVIDLSIYSTYARAYAVMSRVMSWKGSTRDPLEVLIYQEQRQHTPSLYSYVTNINTPVTPDIKLTARQLNIVIRNGVMRCMGRVEKSDLDEYTHTPYFLPRESPLVKLLIKHLHNKHRHCSITQTMTYYRQRVWTPKLRPVVSLLLNSCVVCRCLRPRTLSRPPPASLPTERVSYSKPFEAVGVDNTGSYPVRDTLEEKRYITIFVCTATRNVHLEVTTSLSTIDFLHALRRFTAMYGAPRTILSDNGRNFRGASRTLATMGSKEEIRGYLQEKKIMWKFQTPRAPWKGGHFERLISTVKASLVVSLRNKTLNEEEFRTAVAECQAVVNSRPLTYVSNDVNDEPLTPSHLLRGTLLETLPLTFNDVNEEEDDDVGRRLRHQHYLLTQALQRFRQRWRDEYLTALRQRHYNGCIHRPLHHLREGELVLLQYPGSTRYEWPLAKIVEIYPDQEGVIRTVKVSCRGEEYLRAVTQVVPLELSCETPDPDRSHPQEDVAQESTSSLREEETEDEAETEVSDQILDASSVQEERIESVESIPESLEASNSVPERTPPVPREDGLLSRPVRRAALRQRAMVRELIENDAL